MELIEGTDNLRENIDDQARQNFRVSVTRAKRRATILTPKGDPSVLLIPESNYYSLYAAFSLTR